MKKIILRSAYFTDHKTKRTAVGIGIDCSELTEMKVFCSEETYGQLWLGTMLKLIKFSASMYNPTEDLTIALVSGQPQCIMMAEKIERIFCKMLTTEKPMDDNRIRAIVAADGNHKCLPNDKLYEEVVKELWVCRKTFVHFGFEQHNKPSPEAAKVFNAARSEVKKAPL